MFAEEMKVTTNILSAMYNVYIEETVHTPLPQNKAALSFVVLLDFPPRAVWQCAPFWRESLLWIRLVSEANREGQAESCGKTDCFGVFGA